MRVGEAAAARAAGTPLIRGLTMCSLYSMTNNVDAIRRMLDALSSRVSNLPSMPGIYPDHPAPIVRRQYNAR